MEDHQQYNNRQKRKEKQQRRIIIVLPPQENLFGSISIPRIALEPDVFFVPAPRSAWEFNLFGVLPF